MSKHWIKLTSTSSVKRVLPSNVSFHGLNLSEAHRVGYTYSLKSSTFCLRNKPKNTFTESHNSLGWKGSSKMIWPNLSWKRKPRWHYLAPCPIASWKTPVMGIPLLSLGRLVHCHLSIPFSDFYSSHLHTCSFKELGCCSVRIFNYWILLIPQPDRILWSLASKPSKHGNPLCASSWQSVQSSAWWLLPSICQHLKISKRCYFLWTVC